MKVSTRPDDWWRWVCGAERVAQSVAVGRPRARAAVAVVALVAAVFGAAAAPLPAQSAPTEAYARVAVWTSDPGSLPPDAFLEPRGITVDPYDGSVLVVDGGNRRVQVFAADGTFVRSIGGPSGSPEGLSDPRDVAVQGSTVFVTDSHAGRVALFTSDGRYFDEWTGLEGPWGVAAGADGRIFVVENDASRVAVYDTRGTRLASWGGFGEGVGALNRPTGADVATDGRLFVADRGNARLVVLDRAGDQIAETDALPAAPLDVSIDAAGDVYVAFEDGVVGRRDDVSGLPAKSGQWPVPGLAGLGVATASGDVFATFQDDDRPMHGVRRFGGRPLALLGEWGGVPAPLGRIEAPFRLAAQDGAFVVDAWRRVQRFAADGTAVSQIPAGRLTDLDFGPAPDAEPDVLVTYDTDVARIGPDGVERWRYAVPTTGDDYAWVVAADFRSATDRLAVLDLGGQRVRFLSVDGIETGGWSFRPGAGATTALWDLASALDGYFAVNRSADSVEHRASDTGTILSAWTVPGGALRVASGPAGHAFVLNRHGWVLKYSADGGLLAVWPTGEANPRSRVSDVAVDSSGRVLVANTGLDRIEVYAPDPSGDPGQVPSFEPTCEAVGDKHADPTYLALGAETTITLRVDGRCPHVTPINDVMLVIDHSGSMSAETKMQAAKDAAIAFLGAIDLGQDRVGLVGFNQDAQLLQPLTGNKSNVEAAINALAAGGGTDIAAGVDAARIELVGPHRRPEAAATIVLLTDGGSAVPPALRAAEQARLEGARLFTIGFGGGANVALLQDMASAPTDYYFAPSGPELEDIYRAIAVRIAADVLFTTLTVTDVLPTNMAYVAGSGQPAPTVAGQTLIWRLSDVPLQGMDLTYRVRPMETGVWPTNVTAAGEGTDGLGRRGRVNFPVPEVTVIAPTPTPGPGITPTATVAPTPTRTPVPEPVYLPIARKDACPKIRQHADVVLVIDTSSSMQGRTPSGRLKLDAAVDAARTFVDVLDLTRDAAAVAYFNAEAGLVQPLSRDRAGLARALAALPQAPGTRIDLGLGVAGQALAGPGRHSENLPVVILLTDGRPTGIEVERVEAAADTLKQTGAVLYVVGLGDDVDAALLRRLATDGSTYYQAPDAEALRRIYGRIARELPCRP